MAYRTEVQGSINKDSPIIPTLGRINPIHVLTFFKIYFNIVPPSVVHGAMVCNQESFIIVWRWHQHLSGFLANGQLHRVSRQSRLSANYKGDNEMVPGAVHISPGIYIKTENNPGKHQLGDRLMTAVRSIIASNGLNLRICCPWSHRLQPKKL